MPLVLRSRRDLRPLTESGGPVYLRRDGTELIVRNGAAVRRLPLASLRDLVCYSYTHMPSRGTPYERHGLLVRGEARRVVAQLSASMRPMFDAGEVAQFAKEWGLRSRRADLRDDAEFRAAFGPMPKGVDVERRGSNAYGCLFVVLMLALLFAGAFGGIAGLMWLARLIGIADRPGVGSVLAILGIAGGGVGCLFVMFAVMDAGRAGRDTLRALLRRDSSLRPRPRHGRLALTVEDGELITRTTDSRRLVLPPDATLAPYVSGDERGLVVLDADRKTVLVIRCPFAPREIAAFAAAHHLRTETELTSSAGALEMRLGTLPPQAIVTVTRSPGFFTVAVGATLLGALAYLPLVVGLVLLLGLFLPGALVGFLGLAAAIGPLPFLGPFAFRQLTRARRPRG